MVDGQDGCSNKPRDAQDGTDDDLNRNDEEIQVVPASFLQNQEHYPSAFLVIDLLYFTLINLSKYMIIRAIQYNNYFTVASAISVFMDIDNQYCKIYNFQFNIFNYFQFTTFIVSLNSSINSR